MVQLSISQKTINESFRHVKAHTVGGDKFDNITEAILYMICADCLPLYLVEKRGFRRLMKTTAPLYKIPSRKYFTELLNMKYEKVAAKVKEDLETIPFLTLTCDIWTDMQNRSFLGVTAHYVQDDSVDLKSVTLNLYELSDHHTSEYISDKLKTVVNDWNISVDSVTAVVTDGCANMVKAIELCFSKKQHVPCFAHMLNLVVENALENANVNELLGKVKAIVNWFKRSVVGSDELRKLTKDQRKQKLIQDVPTRWNSKFYMIERFLHLRTEVNSIVNQNTTAPDMINAREIEDIREMLELLRPFESATNQISGDKYITSSIVIPMVRCLKGKILDLEPISLFAKRLKAELLLHLQKRFGSIEQFQLLSLSTLLDPRFKNIHFEDKVAASQTLKTLNDLIKKEPSDSHNRETDQGEQGNAAVKDNSKFSLWTEHHRKVQESLRKQSVPDCATSPELTLYLKSPLADLKENPLAIWKQNSSPASNLQKMARKYLSVVSTAVPSERLFSKAGDVIRNERNRLKGSTAHKLLFLQSIEERYWSF